MVSGTLASLLENKANLIIYAVASLTLAYLSLIVFFFFFKVWIVLRIVNFPDCISLHARISINKIINVWKYFAFVLKLFPLYAGFQIYRE